MSELLFKVVEQRGGWRQEAVASALSAEEALHTWQLLQALRTDRDPRTHYVQADYETAGGCNCSIIVGMEDLGRWQRQR